MKKLFERLQNAAIWVIGVIWSSVIAIPMIIMWLAFLLVIGGTIWYVSDWIINGERYEVRREKKKEEAKQKYYDAHKEEIERERKERRKREEDRERRDNAYIVGVYSPEQYERKEYCSHMHDQYNTQDSCELSIITREEVESEGFKLCKECSKIDDSIVDFDLIDSYNEPPNGVYVPSIPLDNW